MPLIDDFSYKLGDTGVVLNSDSLMTPFVDIKKINGFDSAPIRTTERDHEGTDGGFMDAEYEKGRPVSLEGTAYADGIQVETYLDSLKANWAPSRNPVPLYFKIPGVAERFMWVKPLGVRYDVNQIRRIGCTDIQFQAYAEDPRIYNSTLHTFDILQTSISITGRGYNMNYNYGYGLGGATPDQIALSVDGNRATPITFTIPGPTTNPQIINDTLSITFTLNIDIPSGSTLTVDMLNHTIVLNGVASRRSALLDPDWFFLVPGTNYLRFRASSNNSTVLHGEYYDAWR